MKHYKITFVDNITAETEEEAYNKLLRYLNSCAFYGDATAFNFEEEETYEMETRWLSEPRSRVQYGRDYSNRKPIPFSFGRAAAPPSVERSRVC